MKPDAMLYEKLTQYCAYQERCRADVVEKMKKLNIEPELFTVYLSRLEEENFLNEQRYVKSFVNSHVKKKWGVTKIRSALQRKKLDKEIIRFFLDEIDQETYEEKLTETARRKWKTIKAETLSAKKQKLIAYLLSKGYEYEKIKRAIQQVAEKSQ